jgi:hypothetical protein
MPIWYSVWSFGIFTVLDFGVPRKIWQTMQRVKTLQGFRFDCVFQ